MDSAVMPKSPLPSHPLNCNSHTPNGGSPLRTSVGAIERERLTASIHSLNNGRHPIDLALLENPESANYQPHAPDVTQQNTKTLVNVSPFGVPARDRDKGLGPTGQATSRPASPYTLNPPIDFDGLSWPSELRSRFSLRAATEGSLTRSWDKGKVRSHSRASSGTCREAPRRNHYHSRMSW